MKKDYITITRGDTLSKVGKVKLPVGTWSVAANVKNSAGVLVGTLQCALEALPAPDVLGNTHAILISAYSTTTATWPVSTLYSSLKFSDTSTPVVVNHTAVFSIKVQEAL